MSHYKKWLLQAPLGLAIIGFGASLLGHSIQLKTQGGSLGAWFLWGTVSLIVFNSGIAIFGDAIKHRVLHDIQQTG